MLKKSHQFLPQKFLTEWLHFSVSNAFCIVRTQHLWHSVVYKYTQTTYTIYKLHKSGCNKLNDESGKFCFQTETYILHENFFWIKHGSLTNVW